MIKQQTSDPKWKVSALTRIRKWSANLLTRSIERICRPYDLASAPVTSPTKPISMAVVVGALIFALLYPFVDQNYESNCQWDTHVFATHVVQFRQALATGNPNALPRLAVWPPYFDAYDVLLTILTAATAGIGRIVPTLAQVLPTVEIQTNFWARWMSLGFHCIGMAFLWLALMRLYARPLVALTLTLLVALAPTILENDLGRMDWGVIGSLCAVLYFNICLAQGDQRRSVLISLGVAAGLLVTMKLNGPAFAIFDRLVHNSHKINLKRDSMRKLRS